MFTWGTSYVNADLAKLTESYLMWTNMTNKSQTVFIHYELVIHQANIIPFLALYNRNEMV